MALKTIIFGNNPSTWTETNENKKRYRDEYICDDGSFRNQFFFVWTEGVVGIRTFGLTSIVSIAIQKCEVTIAQCTTEGLTPGVFF